MTAKVISVKTRVMCCGRAFMGTIACGQKKRKLKQSIGLMVYDKYVPEVDLILQSLPAIAGRF